MGHKQTLQFFCRHASLAPIAGIRADMLEVRRSAKLDILSPTSFALKFCHEQIGAHSN